MKTITFTVSTLLQILKEPQTEPTPQTAWPFWHSNGKTQRANDNITLKLYSILFSVFFMFNKHPILLHLLLNPANYFPCQWAYTGEGPTGCSADNNILICSYKQEFIAVTTAFYSQSYTCKFPGLTTAFLQEALLCDQNQTGQLVFVNIIHHERATLS